MLDESVALWRERLMDISWFMRVLNENLARQANSEDDCTGRFWAALALPCAHGTCASMHIGSRFKSQALLDEAALMACMAYVDLNPIRAKMAKTPETSHHTSIQQRISKANSAYLPNHPQQQPKTLLPFAGYPREAMPKGLPFRLSDYLQLVDWTGRILRDDKRGSIDDHTPPILERLKMEEKNWLYLAQHFESPFKGMVGSVYKLKQACQVFNYTRTPGLRSCEQFFT